MLKTLCGILALTAAVPFARAAVGDVRHLAVPGESLGVVRIGMNAPEVHAALEAARATSVMSRDGKPAGFRDVKAGAVIEMWQADSIGKDRFLTTIKVFFVGSRVVQITVNSPLYTTKKGASQRSSSSDLKRLHSSIASMGVAETWSGNVRVYDSVRLGIAATYTVGKDGRERSCQEFIIHEPGSPVRIESYRPKVEATPPAEEARPAPEAPGTPPAEPGAEPMVPGPKPEGSSE